MESPRDETHKIHRQYHGNVSPAESVVKKLLFSARTGGSEKVEGTQNPEGDNVLFGSPKIREMGPDELPTAPLKSEHHQDNRALSPAESGALFAQVLNETRSSERVSDRDLAGF